jgi:hypothetical protein
LRNDPKISNCVFNDERKQFEYTELYSFSDEMALVVGRGSNGFVVTAYPISNADVEQLVRLDANAAYVRRMEPISCMANNLYDYYPLLEYLDMKPKQREAYLGKRVKP